EVQAEMQEENWLEELIKARLKVMDLKDELVAKERELKDRYAAADPKVDPWLNTLGNELNLAKLRLEDLGRILAAPRDPAIAVQAAKIKDLEAAMRQAQKEVAEKVKQRDDAYAGLREMRRAVVVAEERVLAMQRRQDRLRTQVQADLDEARRR